MNNQNNRSASNNVEVLTRLCELVEQACIDIAPTYAEYMPMAFAIANDCGEAGRSLFHRLCRISHKYNPNNADKIFTDALKGGNGANGIGSVFYLAERAGVDLGEFRGKIQIPQPPLYVFRERARTYYTDFSANNNYEGKNGYWGQKTASEIQKNPKTYQGFGISDDTERDPSNDDVELPYESEFSSTPAPFAENQWSSFLQRIVNCGEDKAQQDMLLLGTIAAFGATICSFSEIKYGHKSIYPCLQVFVLAPAASGKGAINWIRQLVMPFHKEKLTRYEAALAQYKVELRNWSNEGRQRDESLRPIAPRLVLFFVAGNNSGTGIQENIIDNGGYGFIIEAEADVLTSAIQADYGQWSHLLRKAHDHEFLSYNRRKDHEYRECDLIRLTVVICGTPKQLVELIPGAENGLFSRQLFYYMPPLDDFKNMLGKDMNKDYTYEFRKWGERWKKVIDAISSSISNISFLPSEEQGNALYKCMSQFFHHAGVAHGSSMRSSVVRLPINLLRMMNVVALMRALDELLMEADEKILDEKLHNISSVLLHLDGLHPAPGVKAENIKDGIVSSFVLTINDEDFSAILGMAETFYRHAEHALLSMPLDSMRERKVSPKERFLTRLPMTFSRKEYLEIGDEEGLKAKQCDYMVNQLVEKETLLRTGHGAYSFREGKRPSIDASDLVSGENSPTSPENNTL
jgi:hypothetical protein